MKSDWKARPEGGGRFALWLIRSIARYGGRGIGRLLLYPITLYFLLKRAPERLASRQYLSYILSRPASLWQIAKHIHTFAATILDRVFLLSENLQRFDVDVTGLEDLHAALDQGRGVLLFGSHLGSFEVLRVLALKRPEYIIRVVLDKGQNPAITELLDALNPAIATSVIDAGQDGTSLALAIKDATDAGALVALLVDRTHPQQDSVITPFLGKPAAFPAAPWLLASVLKVPVVLAFGLYSGGRHYHIYFERFADLLEIPRRARSQILQQIIDRYAQRLEYYARLAPYNWFNFYNFWGNHLADHSDKN